jgi:hypothetical protein
VRTHIHGRDELAGSAVILVHRLLKSETAHRAHGPAGEATGFAVFTDAAAGFLRLDTARDELTAATEEFEHLGEQRLWVVDLERRWSAETDARRLEIGDDALLDITIETQVDAMTAWNHLTSPALRARWEGTIVIDDEPGRRLRAGATLECVTSRLRTIEEIVDWHPYEHLGYWIRVDGVGILDAAYDLAGDESGTAIRLRIAAHDPSDPDEIDAQVPQRRDALTRLADRLSERSERAERSESSRTPVAV